MPCEFRQKRVFGLLILALDSGPDASWAVGRRQGSPCGNVNGMRYAVLTVWNEKRRYLGGVLAVAISNVLICLMVGLLLGLFGLVSLPVDLSEADVWVTGKDVPSCDLASVISRDWENYLRMQPGVTATDEFIQTFGSWHREGFGSSLIVVLGVNIGPSSMGPVRQLSQEQRALLSEEGAVVV